MAVTYNNEDAQGLNSSYLISNVSYLKTLQYIEKGSNGYGGQL